VAGVRLKKTTAPSHIPLYGAEKRGVNMWTFKSKIFFVLYKITASWLPISQRCKFAKRIRTAWAKKIVSYCGKNVNIERHAVFSPDLSIGDNSGIGIDCEVYGPVSIGSDVMMAPEVIIYTSSHVHDRTDIPMWKQEFTKARPVKIGNDVWIGRRAIIMPGVSIGNGVIVGAGAVVTKDIPDFCVAGGVPAQILKKRGNCDKANFVEAEAELRSDGRDGEECK